MKSITHSKKCLSDQTSLGDVVIIEGASGEGKSRALYNRVLNLPSEVDVVLVTREQTVADVEIRLIDIADEDALLNIKVVSAGVYKPVKELIEQYSNSCQVLAIDGPNGNSLDDIDAMLDLADRHEILLILTKQAPRV